MGSVGVKAVALCAMGVTLSSCAKASAATFTATTPSASPGGQWVTESFHGAGLIVTLDHPVTWTSQLQPLSIHYSATFGYLANFPLHQFCTHPTSLSFECTWADIGTIPVGGMIVTFGVEGYGPGPGIPAQLLALGTPTSIDGHAASEQSGNGGCLGVGGDHRTTYFVDDGPTGGVFDVTFCWHGNAASLADDARTVASRLTLRPDPTNAGPHPD